MRYCNLAQIKSCCYKLTCLKILTSVLFRNLNPSRSCQRGTSPTLLLQPPVPGSSGRSSTQLLLKINFVKGPLFSGCFCCMSVKSATNIMTFTPPRTATLKWWRGLSARMTLETMLSGA
ncbi:hypothetical protein ILYODFUR_016602 [Ilyodon furcidens]|uniref:Uncharacterized protein n=1 Tax=Ilyodon furcidens TaxID=33524 RepID=A0ABV0TJ72_9TELE